jgi:hypothetical protein
MLTKSRVPLNDTSYCRFPEGDLSRLRNTHGVKSRFIESVQSKSWFGPKIMLPGMVLAWGIMTTLQSLVKTYSGLLACLFFLGLCEGGLFPGIVLYLSRARGWRSLPGGRGF